MDPAGVALEVTEEAAGAGIPDADAGVAGGAEYPIQKVTEIYKKVIEVYNKVTELENSSWNVLCLLRSEVAYNGTGHILP